MAIKNIQGKEKAIKVLLIPIIAIILYIIVGRFIFLPRVPNEELKRALEFERNKDNIGMTFEECEEMFGELGTYPKSNMLVLQAGHFLRSGFLVDAERYELYIYFDENQCVKYVMLRTISEV